MKTQPIFVVCLLLAAASVAGAQVPSGPTDLDHFNCYAAAPPQGHQPVAALLQDEFDVSPPAAVFLPPVFEKVTDISPYKLCNPVIKDHGGVKTGQLHPDAHLLMYWINNNQPSTPRSVTVQNQFGVSTLTTGPAVILAVPSAKVVISSPNTTPSIPVIERELDHFKCYLASGDPLSSTGVPVLLTDQFFSGASTTVYAPWLFCNPVKKWRFTLNPSFLGTLFSLPTVTGENRPKSHLTCYVTATQGPTSLTPPPVIYNNQFVIPGTVNTLVLSGPDLLCAPSFKLGWNVIPAPTAGP